MSFLGLEGLHVFITGAAGGIGTEAVTEFLSRYHGCKVTAHDLRPIQRPPHADLRIVQGNISDEDSIRSCILSARDHFGPVNILIANAGITDESHEYPIWKIPLELWKKTYDTNIQGTFLTIKHFLQAADSSQKQRGTELENLAIVITGSETGKFGQAGHTEYASGKAGLQYGLIRGVKNEIVRLNGKARVNAVAPGWVDTPLIEGRLDDPKELWAEAQATVPLRKIAQPHDVACTMAFLASHRAAGHISGECISVDGGMEGRIVWKEAEMSTEATSTETSSVSVDNQKVPRSTAPPVCSSKKRRIKVALSVDFDAVSGWLGTGAHPDNNMADFSAGIFAGKVGVVRLVKLFKKLGIADKMTWFIPGHSMETFPQETQMIVQSGCEVALHGYSHEGAGQMNEEQEKDVMLRCIELATKLTGKKPVGWRAPLYQIREATFIMLEELGFEYDTSLSTHDSEAFFAPRNPAVQAPDFSTQPAKSWMQPTTINQHSHNLVEIPCNWYMEDATPMSFYPHTSNSHGYVDPRLIEQMWKDRFTWLWNNEREQSDDKTSFLVFPLVLHPDTSGMAHIVGMVERFLMWLQTWGDDVVFEKYKDIAAAFKMERSGGVGSDGVQSSFENEQA
ncbi:hypothetical protein MMC18_008496 [Xylographa bjoerkii]|nr:hypothetical protein [Xylographa bjoerkii]